MSRKNKDTLFRLIFKEKADLLELYNALRGTDYQNPEELVVTTLDNVLFMEMKNDVSFLIDNVMSLYEHQSTWNPNMPLRGLEYFSILYKKYVKSIDANIYGKRRIPLPFPQYIVFYNGVEEQPERQYLRLSSSYVRAAKVCQVGEEPCLECIALVLNINVGKNRELMEKCRKLSEYAEFVACVRRIADGKKVTQEVMEQAIDECVQKGILQEILTAHRWEVREMFQEFDFEKYVKYERQYAYEDGMQDMAERLNKLTKFLLEDDRMVDLQKAISDQVYQKTLLVEYGLEV